MATKAKNVYFNFVPSSATLAPKATAYDKANTVALEKLEDMRLAVFQSLLAAKKVPAEAKDNFRVGKRWGQWSWWIAQQGETAGKGEEL